MKRLGILMLAMAILMLFGCETAVPEEIAAAPAYDIQAQLEKAEQLFLEGNYEEVILTLDTVLEIEPANVQGYLRLSDAYIARGESYKALELLKRGLEVTGDEQIAARIQGMTEEIDGIVDVAAGDGVTLLVDEDGNAYWCGQEQIQYNFGNVFTNLHRQQTAPSQIEGLPPIKTVSAYRSGNNNGFSAITENGDLYAWGDGAGYLIGPSNDSDSGPIKLWDGVKKAIRSGGGIFCLVLREDGSVYTRGINSNGVLGTGHDFAEEYDSDGSIDVGSNYDNVEEWLFVMDGVRDIKCSTVFFSNTYLKEGVFGEICLAITEEGELYGWGLFGLEERNGGIYKRAYNRPELLMKDIKDADITSNGELFIVTTAGELQHIFITDVQNGAKPVLVPISGDIASISCGNQHICALDTEGILYTSGKNEVGQLGIGKEQESSDYQKVFTPLGDTCVRKVAAGNLHTCVILADGQLLTWGDNEYGQLGNGRMGMQHTVQEPTKAMGQVAYVFASRTYTSAVSEDGILYQAREENNNLFIQVEKNVEMASGELILTKDGLLKELNSNEVLAKDVAYVFSGIYNDAQFYIDKSGRLWGKSRNFSGELGNGIRNDPQLSESQQSSMENYIFIMDGVEKCVSDSISISSGYDNINGSMTLILTESGDVYHCGANPNTLEFVLTPEKIASGMRDIAIDSTTAYLISEEDALYVWGRSRWDYIDEGGQPSHTLQVPKKIFEGVQKISSGFLLDVEGNVYTFGLNTFAETLGLGTQKWSPELGISKETLICKQIELPAQVKDIASFGGQQESYYAVLENGDLYTWGDNQYGQLGLGEAGSEENIFEVKLPS